MVSQVVRPATSSVRTVVPLAFRRNRRSKAEPSPVGAILPDSAELRSRPASGRRRRLMIDAERGYLESVTPEPRTAYPLPWMRLLARFREPHEGRSIFEIAVTAAPFLGRARRARGAGRGGRGG